MSNRLVLRTMMAALIVTGGLSARAGEPPALNPFSQAPSEREDAVPGRIELSDGSVRTGMIYLTRDKRLQIYDKAVERQREIPLQAVKQIECIIKREWLEKEWKFRETTSDVKMYTGRSYPSREYLHTITLKNGRTITGPLSAIVYVKRTPSSPNATGAGPSQSEPEQFLLNKRNKGELGQDMKSLVYVKRITLGKEALEERGKRGAKK